MAWIIFDLDNTLVVDDGMGAMAPTDGAVEAVMQLQNEGHRLSVWTSRFAPMPERERNRLKEEIENVLQSLGFPPLEVWTGTTKPDADLFISDKGITFDNDWGLALAQVQMMLEERGLVPGPVPGAAEAEMDQQAAAEQPEEEPTEETP